VSGTAHKLIQDGLLEDKRSRKKKNATPKDDGLQNKQSNADVVAEKSTEERIDDAMAPLNKLWKTLAVKEYDAFLEKVDMLYCECRHIRDTAYGVFNQADSVCQ
jgi:Skp family chaperone for outer membrane proteins